MIGRVCARISTMSPAAADSRERKCFMATGFYDNAARTISTARSISSRVTFNAGNHMVFDTVKIYRNFGCNVNQSHYVIDLVMQENTNSHSFILG